MFLRELMQWLNEKNYVTLAFLYVILLNITHKVLGERGRVVVKALCYKPQGRGFDTRWGEFLNLPNPSGRTRPWGLVSL
jgi:hypothetical protein